MTSKVEKVLDLANTFDKKAEHSLDLVKEAAGKSSKLDPKAKVRNRGTVCVPAESAKDKKDHFPINNADQARNALARVHQYSKVPDWYSGSLSGLQALVARKVKAKYPSIDVGGKKSSKKSSKKASEYYDEILNKFAQAQRDMTVQRTDISPEFGLQSDMTYVPTVAEFPANSQAAPVDQRFWGTPEFVAMVKDIQKYLNSLPQNQNKQLVVDGKIGTETQKAMQQVAGTTANPMSSEVLSDFMHIPSVAAFLQGKVDPSTYMGEMPKTHDEQTEEAFRGYKGASVLDFFFKQAVSPFVDGGEAAVQVPVVNRSIGTPIPIKSQIWDKAKQSWVETTIDPIYLPIGTIAREKSSPYSEQKGAWQYQEKKSKTEWRQIDEAWAMEAGVTNFNEIQKTSPGGVAYNASVEQAQRILQQDFKYNIDIDGFLGPSTRGSLKFFRTSDEKGPKNPNLTDAQTIQWIIDNKAGKVWAPLAAPKSAAEIILSDSLNKVGQNIRQPESFVRTYKGETPADFLDKPWNPDFDPYTQSGNGEIDRSLVGRQPILWNTPLADQANHTKTTIPANKGISGKYSYDKNVEEAQKALNEFWGYKLKVDGLLGPNTHNALLAVKNTFDEPYKSRQMTDQTIISHILEKKHVAPAAQPAIQPTAKPAGLDPTVKNQLETILNQYDWAVKNRANINQEQYKTVLQQWKTHIAGKDPALEKRLDNALQTMNVF